MKKIFFIALLSYFLVLFQKDFFHFSILGYIPFLVLVSVIFFSVFENKRIVNSSRKLGDGEWASIFGGFFSDIFSSNVIGYRILILLFISLFIKFILKRYGMLPSSKQKKRL